MDIMDTTNYPIDQPESSRYSALVALCQADLAKNSLFNLPGFLRPSALHDTLELVKPVIATKAFVHPRVHNIYFKKLSQTLRQTTQPFSCAKPPITLFVLIKLKAARSRNYTIGQPLLAFLPMLCKN